MLDDAEFMQTRVFRVFKERHGLNAAEADRLFDTYGIWDYLREGYDALHVCGDEAIADDIDGILHAKGAI